MDKRLVVLGCSATKLDVAGSLPAISLYDGPVYRVLRAYLRQYRWPGSLSVAVLSAKYGLIGGQEQDCVACDFRHFCPAPSWMRQPTPPPRTPPTAPGY